MSLGRYVLVLASLVTWTAVQAFLSQLAVNSLLNYLGRRREP